MPPSVNHGRPILSCTSHGPLAARLSFGLRTRIWVDGEAFGADDYDEEEEDGEIDEEEEDGPAGEDEEDGGEEDGEDGEGGLGGEDAEEGLHEEAEGGQAAGGKPAEAAAAAAAAAASGEAFRPVEGLHYFYQAGDGQRVFVHPMSMKCLLHHYGGYLRLPQVPCPLSFSRSRSRAL